MYWGWYEYIRDDASDEAVGIEVEFEVDVEVDVEDWDTQWPEGLIAHDKELKLDK